MSISKPEIPGAILIYSCHKHKETRLKKFTLKKNEYDGWKVFYIIGNPFLEKEYILENNLITIKCEDSYIHVLKKVIMGCKVILDMFSITHGILRCGDDLIFHEEKLSYFLNNVEKTDYMGRGAFKNTQMVAKYDNFMPQYFITHPEDLSNPLNGITYSMEKLLTMNIIPNCCYTGGVVVYLSLRSCHILIQHMENIQWNVFQTNEFGYPYIIEDVGVGFILNINNIYPTIYNLYSNEYIDVFKNDSHSFALHTNMYK
jgi:hypothetical protein